MPNSQEWQQYFEENARSLLEIPWHLGPDLSPKDARRIEKSLKEFQAGESSEGKHLLRYALDYASRTGDAEYAAAIRLFIGEEQRHARDLGRFLRLNGIALIRTTFTDRVFRRLRNLVGNLEVSIAVLITAEIIAKVYYGVLQRAASSLILRRLCDQILRDELRHVHFQAEQLARLRSRRGSLGMAFTMLLQRFLFFGTVIVVAVLHREVIRGGGLTIREWQGRCREEFEAAFARRLPQKILEPVSPGSDLRRG